MKKIFYVPGLISACIIPIIFWFYGNRELQKPIPNVMDIGLPAKVHSTSSMEEKDRIYKNSFEPLRNWDYKKIVVKPNTARINSKYYVSEIKKLQKQNQKETGIEFIITNENSYDDFISILNDCHISKQERYGIDMDKTGHFFILVDYNDVNSKNYLSYDNVILCGTSYVNQDYNNYSENFLGKFLQQLSQLPNPAYYLIFGFLILLNISMFSIKKSLQNH